MLNVYKNIKVNFSYIYISSIQLYLNYKNIKKIKVNNFA